MTETTGPESTTDSSAQQSSEPRVVSKRGRRVLAAIIVILLLALIGISVMLASLVLPRRGAVASGDEAGDIQWVRSIYGWGENPDQQLLKPAELSIDDNGVIWVTDSMIPRALAFNPEGQLIRTVGDNVKEPIVGLGPITSGPDGVLYVGESAVDRVRVFDPEGAELGMFPIPDPRDLYYQDDVFLVATRAGFGFADPTSGVPEKLVGSFGQGDDQFDTVSGVVRAPDGRVFVTDAFNNRLSAYDPDLERLWMVQTGAPGNAIDVTGAEAMNASRETTAPARLQLPSDVTLDGRGRVVVVDAMDFSISVFDPDDGTFIAKYGEFGGKDGQFNLPSSIAYDAQRDWFAVTDAGNSRVQIVRIPDSGGLNPLAAARRALTGPLRACLFPLLLLLIAIVVYVVVRRRRRKAAEGSVEKTDVQTDSSDVQTL